MVAQAVDAGAQQGKEGTRQRLIDAALEVFAERGYHAATLSEIAARAGLTTGAVYSAFGSKKKLLLAVCQQAAQDPDAEGQSASAADVYEAVLLSLRENAATDGTPEARRLVQMQLEMLQIGLRDEEVFSLLSAFAHEQLGATAGLLEELARRGGSTLSMPGVELATLWVAMQNGLALLRLVDPRLAPDSVMVRAASLLAGESNRATGDARRKKGSRRNKE